MPSSSVVAAACLAAALCASGITLPPPGYTAIAALSDEFDGAVLDSSKWLDVNPYWPGRAPGLFESSNVVVRNGTLQLWARAARRNASWPAGFDNYTTASVSSIATVRRGYFEISWRSGSSGISSSWWFYRSNSTTWTEIDVFETTGVNNTAAAWSAKAGDLPSHVHVFEFPGENATELPRLCNCTEGTPGQPPCSKPALFTLPDGEAFASSFHTAGLLWEDAGISVFLDGALVSTIPSPCLVEQIAMQFDRETMPGWMVLPAPATLPDVPFTIEYVRSWAPPARRAV